jgi:beta-alanine degradation protein BauB
MSDKMAEPVVHIDDERFRVTEWRFAPGAETGWHVHGHDYVVVPLTDGRMGLVGPDGKPVEAALKQGVPYSRRTGVAHNVSNIGETPFAFLEIEVVENELEARRLAILNRFSAAWNAHDLDAIMDMTADDCAFHASAGPDAEGGKHVGRDAVRAAYAAIFKTFPDGQWTNGKAMISGDTGLTWWRFVGTTVEGKTVEVDGCDILSFAGEKIALKDSYRKSRG